MPNRENLPPLNRQFVSHFGEMGSRWGINRTVGQIYALVFVSPEPVHADDIAEKIGKRVDLIIDSGHCEPESTTVLDLTEDEIVVVREGKGDLSRVI